MPNSKTYAMEYRKKNRDWLLIGQKRWRDANKDRIKNYREAHKEDRKKWLAENKEILRPKKLAINRIWYSRHRKQENERNRIYKATHDQKPYMKMYREKNKEKLLAYQKEKYRKLPNKRLFNQQTCANRICPEKINIKTIQEVYEDNIKKYGTLTCYLCSEPIEFKQDTLEHRVPISRGGSNIKSNLGISHRGCNSRKHNRTEEEYRILFSQNK